ncbi:MAG TPA: dihydrodipicolinate reductase C-terminal domain-containing protein, partial [Candidatus Limnocylindrales bacterium]
MRALIFGRGAMGRAVRDGLEARGDDVVGALARPRGDPARPEPSALAPVDVAFDFAHGSTVAENVGYALATGCRTIVIGTTAWTTDRPAVARAILDAGARAVAAPTFSVGAVLFGLLSEDAARMFGRFEAYDPYILEWHRRTKADRPSGTALALAERVLPLLPAKRRARLADGSGAPDADVLEVVALRAGASPGLHVFGFDAPGESIELRVTARDRSAYVAGALLAAERLLDPAAWPVDWAGMTDFESIVRAMS